MGLAVVGGWKGVGGGVGGLFLFLAAFAIHPGACTELVNCIYGEVCIFAILYFPLLVFVEWWIDRRSRAPPCSQSQNWRMATTVMGHAFACTMRSLIRIIPNGRVRLWEASACVPGGSLKLMLATHSTQATSWKVMMQ